MRAYIVAFRLMLLKKNEPNHDLDYLFTIDEVEAAIRSMKGALPQV